MKESFETQLLKYRKMWDVLANNPWVPYADAALRSGLYEYENPFCSVAIDKNGNNSCDNCPAPFECPNTHIIRWKNARSTYDSLLKEGVSPTDVMTMTDTLREMAQQARDVTVSSEYFDK